MGGDSVSISRSVSRAAATEHTLDPRQAGSGAESVCSRALERWNIIDARCLTIFADLASLFFQMVTNFVGCHASG